MLDVLIRSGNVIDGAGNPWIRADVGIAGGRIVAVGKLTGEAAQRTIDADGLFVCPGFIDMHTHSDLQLLVQPEWEVKLAQGVTLEVLGQDGLGLAPMTDDVMGILRQQLKAWNGDPPEIAWTWRTVAEYLSRFDRQVSPNVAFLVPHGTVRMQVMGLDNRAPTEQELGAMQALVAQGMGDGAVGLSAGLTYAPAVYSDDDELVALCGPVRDAGGYYAPHHRNYGAGALEAYAASIDIGRRAGVAVHLTHAHMSTPANRGRASELLALVDDARAGGVDTTLDTYPYLAGNSYLHASLPSWVHEGGNAAILARLDDPDARDRIRRQMEGEGLNGASRLDPDLPDDRCAAGESPFRGAQRGRCDHVRRRAELRSTSTATCWWPKIWGLARSSSPATRRTSGESSSTQPTWRAVTASSSAIGPTRVPGTFARYLSEYVREQKLVRLEEMVRKMTSLPANASACSTAGWCDRARLPTWSASMPSTFETPRRMPIRAARQTEFRMCWSTARS